MRQHPISPVTEPLQYRAIGVVRGSYVPADPAQLTRGVIRTAEGTEIEAVVLGRLLTLMRRHLDLETPHLWVVYPRSREENQLHLQMVGVWEPSTLSTPEPEAAAPAAAAGPDAAEPTAEAPTAADQDPDAFGTGLVRLGTYLQLLENRLFSSGLHTLGEPPDAEQRLGYLKAYVG
ncbi:hypothetical protein VB737_05240, partial [Synechococcus sp. BA-120 BA3]|nr:hypothetical protein [Synechococcus sp. BA-120 BA3]